MSCNAETREVSPSRDERGRGRALRTIRSTPAFRCDWRLLEESGKAAGIAPDFRSVVTELAADECRPKRHLDCRFDGRWRDYRGRHIEPDLILAYHLPNRESLELIRLASHSQLGASGLGTGTKTVTRRNFLEWVTAIGTLAAIPDGKNSICGTETATRPGPRRDTAEGIQQSVHVLTTDYSFAQAPFVNPRIIHDFSTWLSDVGDHVTEINLTDAQRSNRYYGEPSVHDTDRLCPFVYSGDSEKGFFGYSYVGITDRGVHVLYTADSGGGSGVFINLMFLAVELSHGILATGDPRSGGVVRADKERVVLRKLGEIGLGDRWSGELQVRGNDVFVGRDRGWFAASGGTGGDGNWSEDRLVPIDIAPEAPLDFSGNRRESTRQV